MMKTMVINEEEEENDDDDHLNERTIDELFKIIQPHHVMIDVPPHLRKQPWKSIPNEEIPTISFRSIKP